MEYTEPRFLRLVFPSLDGPKSIEVGTDSLSTIYTDGVFFDGSSVPGFAKVESSDCILRPASESPVTQSWDSDASLVLCNVYDSDGTRHQGDIRAVLERVVKSASSMGLRCIFGAEVEFFLAEETALGIQPHDDGNYFCVGALDKARQFRREVIYGLDCAGISSTGHHHEVAAGQNEIGIKHTDVLDIADSILIAKLIISELAAMKNLIATFMAKPFSGMNGSGMHLHQSLWDMDLGLNLFANAGTEGDISSLAKSYIAGIIEHAPALTALAAPTINSFRRLSPGYEAPTTIGWGFMNRTSAIRIPRFIRANDARIEYRCSDSSCNPYLMIAGCIAAGIDGIHRDLEPPSMLVENAYDRSDTGPRLPSSLYEALQALLEDPVIIEALGPAITASYTELKLKEIQRYGLAESDTISESVTSWELGHYLRQP